MARRMRKQIKKVLLNKRVWLNNDPSMQGHLRSHVVTYFMPADPTSAHAWQREASYNVDAELSVTDCSRTVFLDFNASRKCDVKAMRSKIARLRQYVNEFCDKYEAALDEFERL